MSLSEASKALQPDMSVSIGGLDLSSFLINCIGRMAPRCDLLEETLYGRRWGHCSKGLTRYPKAGNRGVRIWETPSGLLNSIGLQNEGLQAFIEKDLPEISSSEIPVVVNLAIETLEEAKEGLIMLRSVANRIAAVELNVSCPNVDFGGMSWGSSEEGVSKVLEALRPIWEGMLWVKLTPQAKDLVGVAMVAQRRGADAVVVSNTCLAWPWMWTERGPVFDRITAGLSGPAVFPLALKSVTMSQEPFPYL